MKSVMMANFIPQCLKEINQDHAAKFEKVRNVFIYYNLGLPTTNIYVLDDQNVIEDLISDNVSKNLEMDIRELVKGSLVIRMDIATNDEAKRQLLPRTQEERELNSALNWLKLKSREIKAEVNEDIIFIFHNFVPAVSSAFAFAAPGQRKVQIEALWGLPEGLYYNSHDKYIVDTQTPRINDLDITRFKTFEKRRFKQFYISPDEDGHWTRKILKSPYDWKGSIQKEEWVKEIALESRRIADSEGKSLSIMWFVNVDSEICPKRVFPWYHEHYDSTLINRAKKYRTKTPFDKSWIIQSRDDIEYLQQEVSKSQSSIRRIRIRPCEDDLLRNKNTLKEIGELANKLEAVILLEGGVLSHAYYQLMQTGAMVEVIYPFDDDEDKRKFYKLVRDKVPSNIEQGGEVVHKGHLSRESLLRTLKEKLVEEAFEVLDAVDQDTIVEELSDVSEVIEGILNQINISRSVLEEKQKQKFEKAGGFNEGIALLETRNPLPTKKELFNPSLFNDIDLEETQTQMIDDKTIIEQSRKIDKWSDKREHHAANEEIMHLTIPVIRDSWVANTSEKTVSSDPEFDLKIQLVGTRVGSKYQIEVSVFTQLKQLKLFD